MGDLSQVSDADLQAYYEGRFSDVSDEGLQIIYAAQQSADITRNIQAGAGELDQYAEGSPPVVLNESAAEAPEDRSYFPEGVASALDRARIGVGQTINEGLGLVGLDTDRLPTAADARARAEEDAKYELTPSRYPGFASGQFTGTMLEGAPLAAAKRFAPLALGSAALGFMQPTTQENDLATRSLNAGLFGAGGVFGYGAGKGLEFGVKGLLNPSVAPGAKRLQAQGIDMTPGQYRGGLFRTFENLAESIPIFGPAIVDARRRGVEQFGNAALNRVLSPLGQTTQKTGQAGVREASKIIGKAYDDIYDNLVPEVKIDQMFADSWNAAAKNLVDYGNAESAEQFGKIGQKFFHDPLRGKIKNEIVPGRLWGDIQRNLRDHGFELQQQGQMDLANAVFDLSTAMNEMTARVAPKAGEQLQKANQAHTRLRPVRNAAATAATSDGVFTPAQLIRGAGKEDKIKSRYAQGRMPMQGFAQRGQRLLPSTIPNTATADRAMAANLGGIFKGLTTTGLASAGAGGVLGFDPTTSGVLGLAGLALARRPYTNPALMRRINSMRNRPNFMRRMGGGFNIPPVLSTSAGMGLFGSQGTGQ